jgi:hypothetical protein
MPNRILRDGILTSDAVDSLSNPAEVFYRRLMSIVDDYGRYFAKPSLLRAACYPLRLDKPHHAHVDDTDVVRFLAELCNTKPAALALVYEVGGKQYLELQNFKQQVRTNAKFPAPPAFLTSLTASASTTGDSDVTRRDSEHLGGVGGGVGDVVEGDRGCKHPQSPVACPHLEIIKLYSQHLPMGRQVRPPWNGPRATALAARWKELPERQRLEWWDAFFAHCAKSEFLTGKVSPRMGRKPFEVSLDWIVTASNFQKIIEGAYDD